MKVLTIVYFITCLHQSLKRTAVRIQKHQQNSSEKLNNSFIHHIYYAVVLEARE